MSVKGIRESAAHMIDKGRTEEAADLLLEFWLECEDDLPKSLMTLIDRIYDNSPKAAYVKAFHLADKHGDEAERLFNLAAKSDDDVIAGTANMSLASINLVRGHADAALPFLKKAVEYNIPSAKHLLAVSYAHGQMGLKKDVNEAAYLLSELLEDNYSEAKVTLAQMILARELTMPDVDPFQLLAEAAASGVEEAMLILMELSKDNGNAQPDEEPMLPYVVVPNGTKRPNLVRDALVSEFDISKKDAEQITAGLYGYPRWSLLFSAATDPKLAKGKFDEELEPAALNERNELLASVLCFYIEMEDYVADIAINLLKPTAQNGKPSLKKLQERVDNCMVPISSSTINRSMNRITDQFGVGGDVEKAIRTASPARADIWLEALTTILGWKFDETDSNADADGAWIGRTTSRNQIPFDVFISRAAFTPGDRGDDHVFQLQKQIARRTTHGVLIFSKPLVHCPSPKKDQGALFGGLILNDSQWSEFVLRPEGGIDDAIAQKLHISEDMKKKEVAAYVFDGAVSLGRTIASYMNDIDPREEMACVPFGTVNGWTNFIPREAAQMIKQLM